MRAKILTLGLISLLMVSSVLSARGKDSGVFWDTVFRGMGYELMYLRMNNGKMLKYTTYNRATIDRTDFFTFLMKKGYTVAEIKVCIHNHPANSVAGFSDNDKKFYEQICKAGFKGKFQVYHRGKIYDLSP